MRTRELQGLAANLSAMVCSERINADFEVLAGLPDGEVILDLLAGTANHSEVGAISLSCTAELSSWLHGRLSAASFTPQGLESARVSLKIDISRPPTHRATLISFRFYEAAVLRAKGRAYSAEAQNHLWHNRPPNKALNPTSTPPLRGRAAAKRRR